MREERDKGLYIVELGAAANRINRKLKTDNEDDGPINLATLLF